MDRGGCNAGRERDSAFLRVQQLEKKVGAGEGIVKGVVAVGAVDTERFNQIRERVAAQSRAQVAGERERIARLDAVRREAEAELLALLVEHPHVELVVVRHEQRVASQKLEELTHRLFRSQTMLREEIQRQPMHPFRPWVHFARGAHIHAERAYTHAVHILDGGDLTDFVPTRAASRFRVEHDHPSAPGVFRNLRHCVGAYTHGVQS